MSIEKMAAGKVCGGDVADLGTDKGHRVLTVVRKGARKAKIPLTLATGAALDGYLAAGHRDRPPCGAT